MYIKSIVYCIFTIVFYWFIIVSPAMSAEVNGRVIGFACSGCHGTDGKMLKSNVPKIQAQVADKLSKLLLDFKYDRRHSTIMGRISKGYTDSELKSVAWYFSRLR